jgi:4-amino-4-deoxy-L-arabinose transferase-like glycosyltransferase
MPPLFRAVEYHSPLLLILLLYAGLALLFSITTPLGEAPDEPAQFQYARFLAENGHLPANLSDRQAAGYRSTWPPLYHLLVAGGIKMVGDQPPTKLKNVGDTARRLIPTNGQTIAAIIHTEDESWPWQGVTLAWHLGRFISITLSLLTITVTYLIVWHLTHLRWAATAVAATHAFLPQFLFTSTVVTDDSLLFLLTGLIILIMLLLTQQELWPRYWQFIGLGAALGLATVTKYNALPFWGVVAVWLVWFVLQQRKRPFRRLIIAFGLVGVGAILTAGWWFWFAWANFNQVASLGWIQGSLAALSAGTADASLRQLGSGTGLSIPSPVNWVTWTEQMFRTFWGSFGGGGTINFPVWTYGLLAILTLMALLGLLLGQRPPHAIFLFIPLFMLPLPMLRFILSNNPVETAQGRHLFPALSIITFVLVWGLAQFGTVIKQYIRNNHLLLAYLTFPLLLVGLSFLALANIKQSYPPPIPLRTTFDPDIAAGSLRVPLAPGVILVGAGVDVDENNPGTVVANLRWQADEIPPADYLIRLTVTNEDGEIRGGWIGHPIGGRYPTRAWDRGDQLYDTIPVLINTTAISDRLTVEIALLDSDGKQAGETAHTDFFPVSNSGEQTTISPATLRADQLPPDLPFTYRSTISLPLTDRDTEPLLVGPEGNHFSPDWIIPGITAHYIVDARWPAGDYQIQADSAISPAPVPIINRPRQFTVRHRWNTLLMPILRTP